MAHHERDCEKRPRRCGKRGCEFVAHNRNEALDHLRDAHAYYVWIHFEDKETELEWEEHVDEQWQGARRHSTPLLTARPQLRWTPTRFLLL